MSSYVGLIRPVLQSSLNIMHLDWSDTIRNRFGPRVTAFRGVEKREAIDAKAGSLFEPRASVVDKETRSLQSTMGMRNGRVLSIAEQ